MSLLNRANDGNHSVLVAVVKLLLSEKKHLSRDSIVNLCAPGEVGDPAKVRQTVNRWIELGLIQEKNDRVLLHEDVRKEERSIECLPDLARRLVLRSENNSDLWAKEDARASDFTRAMSWLLAQDVWGISADSWDDIQSLTQEQIGRGSTIIQNDVRWQGLKAWAKYLGFAWTPSAPRSAIVIDPTRAVRAVIPKIYGKRKSLESAELLKALAAEIPVIDGGSYRKEVEDLLGDREESSAWSPPPNNQISTSLSRSILRLTVDGTLVGENKADSDDAIRITLTGRNHSKLKTFSHFTRG